jgi:hypothetical protein
MKARRPWLAAWCAAAVLIAGMLVVMGAQRPSAGCTLSTPGDDQQRRRFIDCEAAVIQQIARTHGVSPGEMRAQ